MHFWKIALVSTFTLLLAGCSLLESTDFLRSNSFLRSTSFLGSTSLLGSTSFLGSTRCSANCSKTVSTSSLVDFLYPGGATPPAEDAIPQLRVPLRVGLAFLPERTGTLASLPASRKAELLNRIRARFENRKFVREIVVLPDYYLKDVRGFEGLAGVQRLYDIDLMALVSYDQVTHLDKNKLSLAYITIVGAYVIKGDRHDTTTLVDLAVVDPATRSLVLRAGGTDTRYGSATLVDQERESRETAIESFAAATGQVIQNFDRALLAFETDVRTGKANVRVAQRNPALSSNGGGGAMSWWALVLLLPLALFRRNRSSLEAIDHCLPGLNLDPKAPARGCSHAIEERLDSRKTERRHQCAVVSV